MITPLYFSFRCNETIAITYLGVISSLTILCVILFLVPSLSTEYYRNLRIAIFVAFAASGIIPIVHLYLQYGISDYYLNLGLGRIYLVYAIYGIGAIFYTTRIPERWSPIKFDIFFHSHQIWHVFVFTASFCHYYASFLISEESLSRACMSNGLLLS